MLFASAAFWGYAKSVSLRFPLLVVTAITFALLLFVQTAGAFGLPVFSGSTPFFLLLFVPVFYAAVLTGTLDAKRFMRGSQELGYRGGLLLDAVLASGIAMLLLGPSPSLSGLLATMCALPLAWLWRRQGMQAGRPAWLVLSHRFLSFAAALLLCHLAIQHLAVILAAETGAALLTAKIAIAAIVLVAFVAGGWQSAVMLGLASAMLAIVAVTASAVLHVSSRPVSPLMPFEALPPIWHGIAIAGLLCALPGLSQPRPWQSPLRFGVTLMITGAATMLPLLFSKGLPTDIANGLQLERLLTIWPNLVYLAVLAIFFAQLVFLFATDWQTRKRPPIASQRLARLRLVAIIASAMLAAAPPLPLPMQTLLLATGFGLAALSLLAILMSRAKAASLASKPS
jgi:hypothetical protein